MNFTGFCTYPHGGTVTVILMLSATAAFAATLYAVAACNFIIVTFTSNDGSLEEYFGNQRGAVDGTAVSYKAFVGLYQWLRPVADVWSDGHCVGYQETMLDRLGGDPMFDAARMLGVFAALWGGLVTLFVWVTACLKLNVVQAWLFCGLGFLGAVCTGLTFVFFQSPLCTSEFVTRSCEMAEGGLIMMAATALWLVVFSVAFWFVLPSVARKGTGDTTMDMDDDGDGDRKMRAALAQRKAREKRQKQAKSTKKASKKSKTKVPVDQSIPKEQKSYSFDSLKDWTKPIPSRKGKQSQSSTRGKTYTQQQVARQQRRSKKSNNDDYDIDLERNGPPRTVPIDRKSRTQSSLTHDNNRGGKSECLAQRLDRIERMADF